MPSELSWHKESVILIVYAFTALFLILSSIYNRVEYQDSWSLEGLLPQTLLFTVAFVVYAVNIKKNSKLVILISTYLLILSAVPNLKYLQVIGTFDSIAHMGYAERLASLGHVPTTGFYSKEYSGTPGLHIFLASLSLITGFSMTVTVKILLLILAFSIPLITYYFIRRVFDNKISKFIIYSLCVTLPIYTSIFGTSFALPLYFIFISTFLNSYIASKNFAYIVILFISSASIIISHGVTSLFLSVLLGSIFLFVVVGPRIFKPLKNYQSFPKITIYLAITISAAVLIWWLFNAQYLIKTLLNQIINGIFSSEPSTQIIPSKFFEINTLQQITLLFIRFYDVFLVASLSLLGIIIFYSKMRKDFSIDGKSLVERVILITVFIVLISTPFLFILKSYTFERFYWYFKPLSPILIGLGLITLFTFFRKKVNTSFTIKLFSALFLMLLIIPNLFTIFIYQPVLPKDNNGEYIVDYREINTIYQSSMIKFAESHYFKGLKIGADPVTAWQMSGLTSTKFYSNYLYIDPLTEDYTKVNLILLHYSGISGPLNERLEFRSQEAITLYKVKPENQNNIIYDNSQSFIILRSK